MMCIHESLGLPKWAIILIIILAIWEIIWKLIAMWKSARKNQLFWFLLIAIINSLGIIPIYYLFFKKDKEQ